MRAFKKYLLYHAKFCEEIKKTGPNLSRDRNVGGGGRACEYRFKSTEGKVRGTPS